MLKSLRKTALAAVAATSLLALSGAGQAATLNPLNNVVDGGSYDVQAGPYAFGVFFTGADAATSFSFSFFNASATTTTVGAAFGTLLQGFSQFAGGMTAAWANGQSFTGTAGVSDVFKIETVLLPGAMDTLTLAFGDPQGPGIPGLQMNVASVAAVPLPAGGLLLLGALGGMAALRRRRKTA